MRWVVPWPCSSLFSLQLQFLTRFRKSSRNNVVPTENTNYDIVSDTPPVLPAAASPEEERPFLAQLTAPHAAFPPRRPFFFKGDGAIRAA